MIDKLNSNQMNISDVLKGHPAKRPVEAPKEKANEFAQHLNELNKPALEAKESGELSFSRHALKRMEERKIDMSTDELMKIRDAIGRLKDKGGKSSLVVSKNGAYIVDVSNNKVVTAIDKGNIGEGVFTKIDSTVFIN